MQPTNKYMKESKVLKVQNHTQEMRKIGEYVISFAISRY